MGYPEFTKEMRKDYTILIPNMLPVHFKLMAKILSHYGYRVALPTAEGRAIVDEGLRYVHNDTCYPALLCIGQMLCTLKSGQYDPHKVALMLAQTGGGCRASNYVCLLRKALDRAGFGYVPVISLNFAGTESCSGFRPTLPMARRTLASLAYGDLLMLLQNQVRPYEAEAGASEALLDRWVETLSALFLKGKGLSRRAMAVYCEKIAADFAAIPVVATPKIKVGIVGEIYVKFAPFANNHLQEFLWEQGCEVMVPGLLEFLLYCVQDYFEDYRLYGQGSLLQKPLSLIAGYLTRIKDIISESAKRHGFIAASSWKHMLTLTDGILDRGCKMGEGWLLPAEMAELVELGYGNIVAVQPFGCLPNHIVSKGMVRKLKSRYPEANIVAVDYDPGATAVNQQNRIKLMLAVAGERTAAGEP